MTMLNQIVAIYRQPFDVPANDLSPLGTAPGLTELNSCKRLSPSFPAGQHVRHWLAKPVLKLSTAVCVGPKELEIVLTGTRNLCAAVILVTLLALAGASCEAKHGPVMPPSAETAESRPGPGGVSLIRMNDPKVSGQLLSGFYGIEGNSWRWTAGKFSARLHVPPSAASAGATLTLELTVPEVAIQNVGEVTLTASINGMELQSARYDHSGTFVFTADVPPSIFTSESVTVDFSLDKTFHAGSDARALGIIAASLRLAGK